MSPGGHLITTAAACAVSQATIGSWAFTTGVALGGFLIDIDHVVDYVFFERGRPLSPGAFLRHYLEGRTRRVVLALHSYELFAALLVLGWATGSVPLQGYLVGGLMHLALDIIWNGRLTPRSIAAFYSFGYRVAHRFDAATLLGSPRLAPTGRVWTAFFRGAALAPGDAVPVKTEPAVPASPPLANLPS